MNIGVVMAGGRGKRFGAVGKNKTAEEFMGKPLVKYGTDLYLDTLDMAVVVVGIEAESVKAAVGESERVIFATQAEPKGTGDALMTAVDEIERRNLPVEKLFVGNGDHMMFYNREVIERMNCELEPDEVWMAMVTTIVDPPEKLAWGRVIKDVDGKVVRIVEQRDATEDEVKITEQNVNFFAYKYPFVRDYCHKISPSPISGEYYITEMVGLAVAAGGKVAAVPMDLQQVGFGANSREELAENAQLLTNRTPDFK